MTALSLSETLRRIDELGPGQCCDEHGWVVYPDSDGGIGVHVCPCIDDKLLALDDDAREALIVTDADVHQLPDAIAACRLESRRRDAGEGPEWEYDS